ncbi:MAG: hypothetical protein SVS15_04575 [Thermodesulfobacteriota bacterium]|nr:hypothetical protein [Thermodesulfobacteriota bacterium]
MSDKELGKKMAEEEALLCFLDAYKEVVEEYLSYGFARQERPDFICYRPDETLVGVELVKIMSDPRDVQMDADEALKMLYRMIEKKDEKRREADWDLPDNTILVLQFVECPISSLYSLDDSLKGDFEAYGFDEIWIADYTGEEAYGDIELFCLYPPEWWGFCERSNPCRKPYG